MRRFVVLLVFAASSAPAQPTEPTEPLEYYLPLPVQDTVAAYVATLPPAQWGEPFIIWRGQRGDAYELDVVDGHPLPCDSLRLARTNRVTYIGGVMYKVTLADDDAFAVHEWTDSPLDAGPRRLPVQCAVMRHGLFMVRFDKARSVVLSAGREP